MPRLFVAIALLTVAVGAPGCVAGPETAAEVPTAATCHTCGAVGRGDDVLLGDGRRACRSCAATAVTDPREAARLLSEARQTLARAFGIDVRGVELDLQLVDAPTLQRRAEELTHPDLRAFTEVEELSVGGWNLRRRFTLYVLSALPRAYLLGVLAHELVHVWQAELGVAEQLSDPLREGTACYVQRSVLRGTPGGARWAQALELNRDPVYGGGLRRFDLLVRRLGLKAAIRHAARGPDFPSGH